MSQELFNYLIDELDCTPLDSNLHEIKSIVKSEYINDELHNVTEQAIVVYGKIEKRIVYFRIFEYPWEEYKAKAQFDRLINDNTITNCEMLTIDKLSEVLEP